MTSRHFEYSTNPIIDSYTYQMQDTSFSMQQQQDQQGIHPSGFTAGVECSAADKSPSTQDFGEWQSLDGGDSPSFIYPHTGDLISMPGDYRAGYHDNATSHSYYSYPNSDSNRKFTSTSPDVHYSESDSIATFIPTSMSAPQSQRIDDTLYDGFAHPHSHVRALSSFPTSTSPGPSSVHMGHQYFDESLYYDPAGDEDSSSTNARANTDFRNLNLGEDAIQNAGMYHDGSGSLSDDEWAVPGLEDTMYEFDALPIAQPPTGDIYWSGSGSGSESGTELAVDVAAADNASHWNEDWTKNPQYADYSRKPQSDALFQQWYEEISNFNRDPSGYPAGGYPPHPSSYSHLYPTHLSHSYPMPNTPSDFTSSESPLSPLEHEEQRPESEISSALSVSPYASFAPLPLPVDSAPIPATSSLISSSSSSLPPAVTQLLPLHAPRPTRAIEIARFDLIASSESESYKRS